MLSSKSGLAVNELLAKLAIMPWPRVFLIAAVVAGLYWQFGLEEGVTEEQFQAAEVSKEKAQASLEDTQKKIADLKKFREELDLMNSQFQQVVELMPTEVNIADFMLLIREEATKTGARVKKLEPAKDVKTVDFYETRKLDIVLEGSYAQILTFLSNLSRLKRLVTVDKLALSQTVTVDQESKVLFSGTLVSYRYLAQPTPGASPAPAAGGSK